MEKSFVCRFTKLW